MSKAVRLSPEQVEKVERLNAALAAGAEVIVAYPPKAYEVAWVDHQGCVHAYERGEERGPRTSRLFRAAGAFAVEELLRQTGEGENECSVGGAAGG